MSAISVLDSASILGFSKLLVSHFYNDSGVSRAQVVSAVFVILAGDLVHISRDIFVQRRGGVLYALIFLWCFG